MTTSVRVLIVTASACGRLDFGPVAVDAIPVVPSGAVAWWKLDETSGTTASDSIGVANGALSAGPSGVPAWTAGYRGGALAFTGDGDLVEIASPPSVTNLPELTVAAWILPTSVAVGLQCVLDKGDVTVGWTFEVAKQTVGGLAFTGEFASANASRAAVGGSVAAGTWTHVVATWDGGTLGAGVHLYANGAELAYARTTDAVGERPDDSTIGLSINCTNNIGMAGKIDDVRVWNRPLDAGEVESLYEATR